MGTYHKYRNLVFKYSEYMLNAGSDKTWCTCKLSNFFIYDFNYKLIVLTLHL